MRKSIVPWFFKLDTYSWNFFIIWIIYPLFDFARQKKESEITFSFTEKLLQIYYDSSI